MFFFHLDNYQFDSELFQIEQANKELYNFLKDNNNLSCIFMEVIGNAVI